MTLVSKRLAALLLGLATLIMDVRPTVSQSMAGDPEAGRLYAVNICSGCHSVQSETDGTGQFAPDFTAIAKRRSTTPSSLRAYLRSDHELMPNFNMHRSEINDMVAYIMSFRRR
jgi:mono/diheme cytochrome c family protein